MYQIVLSAIPCSTAVGLRVTINNFLHAFQQQIAPGPLAALAGFSIFRPETAFLLVEDPVLAEAVVILPIQQLLLSL